MMDVGRVCVKRVGRDAGALVVILKVLDDNYVLVEGPTTKRTRCNKRHLIPTEKVLPVREDMPREEILKLLEEAR